MDIDGGRMNRVMMVVVMMLVVLLATVVPECKGQQQPCPQNLSKSGECCLCSDSSLLCQTACPPRHSVSYVLSVCMPLTTTTTTTTAPNRTLATFTTLPPPSTSPSQLLRCLPCHATCKSCSGMRAEDCLTCADNHRLQKTNGTTRCVRNDASTKDSSNVGGIVGGTIAAVVAVVVVVVVVVGWWYRRKRRLSMNEYPKRSISTLMGSGTAGAVSSSAAVQGSASDMETGEVEVKAETRSKVQSVKDPTYVNVQTTVPKMEAIERARDQVLRYTPDPTVKGTTGQGHTPKTKQKPGTGASEDEELASLPAAPKPPRQDPALTPPQINYEVVDSPFPPAAKPQPPVPPKPEPAPAPEGPTESYEVMEFPVSPSGSSRTSALHPRVGLLKTGSNDQKRNTTAGLRAPSSSSSSSPFSSTSLPSPRAPISCPNLPKFPIEEHREKKAVRKLSQSQQKTQPPPPQPPPPHTYTDLEEPEDDYVNVGSKKKEKAKAQTQEASDPEEDYENSGPMKKLIPHADAPEQSTGVDNPAAEVLDEPQEMYGNQAMVDEVKSPDRNTPGTPSQGRGGVETEQNPVSGEGSSEVSEQPTYGNEVSGNDEDNEEEEEEDPAYQNCPPRRSQS